MMPSLFCLGVQSFVSAWPRGEWFWRGLIPATSSSRPTFSSIFIFDWRPHTKESLLPIGWAPPVGAPMSDAEPTLATMCIKGLVPRLYASRKPGLSVVSAGNRHVYSCAISLTNCLFLYWAEKLKLHSNLYSNRKSALYFFNYLKRKRKSAFSTPTTWIPAPTTAATSILNLQWILTILRNNFFVNICLFTDF